ncbi:hypothetical protein L1987_18412 [Smallanthus sonchifolius]|uniref:Uncharacterized protein n=1 Tax=Smallanthus sonchifolius TaxID=185202 RepID=A0ACB9IZN7_9ASTR|nr:hypothetical protein L1987_18412 [Smallanthus sonchifolius]
MLEAGSDFEDDGENEDDNGDDDVNNNEGDDDDEDDDINEDNLEKRSKTNQDPQETATDPNVEDNQNEENVESSPIQKCARSPPPISFLNRSPQRLKRLKMMARKGKATVSSQHKNQHRQQHLKDSQFEGFGNQSNLGEENMGEENVRRENVEEENVEAEKENEKNEEEKEEEEEEKKSHSNANSGSFDHFEFGDDDEVNDGGKSVDEGDKQVYTTFDGKVVENIADIAEDADQADVYTQIQISPDNEDESRENSSPLSPLTQELVELGGS